MFVLCLRWYGIERELSVCETCWPYDTLSSTALEITANGTARRNSNPAAATGSVTTSTGISSSSIGGSGVGSGVMSSVSFGTGHLFAGCDHLVVLPGHAFDNSLMRWCGELDPKCSLLEPVLRIPWGQVKRGRCVGGVPLLPLLLHLKLLLFLLFVPNSLPCR